MNRLRIAVIGAGYMGRKHLQYLSASADCRLAALVDPDPAAQRAAREHGARHYRDAAALLSGGRPDRRRHRGRADRPARGGGPALHRRRGAGPDREADLRHGRVGRTAEPRRRAGRRAVAGRPPPALQPGGGRGEAAARRGRPGTAGGNKRHLVHVQTGQLLRGGMAPAAGRRAGADQPDPRNRPVALPGRRHHRGSRDSPPTRCAVSPPRIPRR